MHPQPPSPQRPASPARTPVGRGGSGGGRAGRPAGVRGRGRPPLPLLSLLLLLPLGGCLPIPDVRLELQVSPPRYRLAPSAVPTRYRAVEGYPEPHTPAEFNRSYLLQYALDEPADTVVVMMPGIFGGAASFDPLARQLVAAVPGLQVWAVDRRANALEDRTGFRAAQSAEDGLLAVRYYLERRGRPGGFQPLRPEQVPFMAYWGLEVHLHDLHRVILEARRQADTVLLAGHSLGASLVSLYTAYRVEPGASGADFIDGLVLLDGTLGRTGAFERPDEALRLFGITLVPSLDDVLAGRVAPFFDLGLIPNSFVRRGVVAHLARYAPDADAPPGLSEFPISNEALAGLRADDEYAPAAVFSASVGEARFAEFDGNLLAVILGGLEGARSRSVVGVAPGAERVEWWGGDPRREHTDLADLLRAWTYWATDFSEWYFPAHLGVEITLLDIGLLDDPRFVPNDAICTPTLAFAASRGLVTTLQGFQSYANVRYGSPIGAYLLPGYTHLDVVTARDNPIVPVLQRWLRGLQRPECG